MQKEKLPIKKIKWLINSYQDNYSLVLKPVNWLWVYCKICRYSFTARTVFFFEAKLITFSIWSPAPSLPSSKAAPSLKISSITTDTYNINNVFLKKQLNLFSFFNVSLFLNRLLLTLFNVIRSKNSSWLLQLNTSEAYSKHCQPSKMKFFATQLIAESHCENSTKQFLITQSAITCSKLTIKTLEHGVKYIYS